MKRRPLIAALNVYKDAWLSDKYPALLHTSHSATEEAGIVKQFEDFIHSTPACFERSHEPGHITGSAIVVSSDFKEVLLTLHAKLKMWLQLGGHADGNHFVHEVAACEVREESGLQTFSFFDWNGLAKIATFDSLDVANQMPLPFDLDAHWIPANKKDPGHWHYDIRYVVVAPRNAAIAITDESIDLRWFTLAEARAVTPERSMHRQFDKIAHFASLAAQ